jgi:hypothetical protein
MTGLSVLDNKHLQVKVKISESFAFRRKLRLLCYHYCLRRLELATPTVDARSREQFNSRNSMLEMLTCDLLADD